MSRWRAAGFHFLISLAILAGALALMRLLWYPDFYFAAIGASGLLIILFSVDVTLGPLITLIIFKSGKKGLKFDLCFIAACQLAALFYGVYTMALARPVFTVFNDDRFEVVQAVDIDLSDARYPEFQALPWTGPRWAAVKADGSDDEFVKALLAAVLNGERLSERARFFVPYDEIKSRVPAAVRPLNRLRRKGKQVQLVDEFLSAHGITEEQVGYLPITAREEHMAIMIARASGDILGVVRINPW
jgi:hypothetical protein